MSWDFAVRPSNVVKATVGDPLVLVSIFSNPVFDPLEKEFASAGEGVGLFLCQHLVYQAEQYHFMVKQRALS